jgi:putative tryptophan/tyrosine transport system substrate-binding protein
VVRQGFVKSLARPGGNATGITMLYNDSLPKEVEMLSQLPSISSIAVLCNPTNESMAMGLETIRAAAKERKVEIVALEARTPQEVEEAFRRATVLRANALLWLADSFLYASERQIAALALKHRLPSIGWATQYPEDGGLLGYGRDRPWVWRHVAEYVDKVLKGAKPADLPVEQPTKFELVINKKTAKALGLTIPPELLVQADRVIE